MKKSTKVIVDDKDRRTFIHCMLNDEGTRLFITIANGDEPVQDITIDREVYSSVVSCVADLLNTR